MKFRGARETAETAGAGPCATAVGDRTRDLVIRSVFERGPQTAAALATQLGLSAAGVRRHLDALVADGLLAECDPRPGVSRGRGRPARRYTLTDAGRAAFPHAYDDLATTALRYLHRTGGDAAVTAFADDRAATLAGQLRVSLRGRTDDGDVINRTEALAEALSAQGYASTTERATAGVQLCQHHCPVAHVAAQFPQLCEAETRAFETVLGTYVQRLATIAHGDGVCTTHVPLRDAATAASSAPANRAARTTQTSQTTRSSIAAAGPLGGRQV